MHEIRVCAEFERFIGLLIERREEPPLWTSLTCVLSDPLLDFRHD